MTEEVYYTIGEVSALCNISTKTLRYYDTINLVVPKQRDSENNYRYYTKEQVLTILNVKKLRQLNFCLKEIHDIISSDNPHIITISIERKLVELRQQIDKLNFQYLEGEYLLKRLQKGVDILDYYDKFKDYQQDNMVLETIPEMNLFFNRQLMKNYKNSEMSVDRWRDITNKVDENGLTVSGSILVTFLSQNPLDKFLLQDIVVEFAVQVEEYKEETEFRKFHCDLALTAIHIGSYSTILNTYIKMINWIKSNNYEICGYCTEEFIISPLDMSDDNCHITKIIIPVKELEFVKNN